MNRNDILKLYRDILEEKGYKYTLKELDVILKGLDDLLGEVGENLEVGENAFVGCIKVSKIKLNARKGKLKGELTSTGEDLEWENPPKERITLNARESFRNKHDKIIDN